MSSFTGEIKGIDAIIHDSTGLWSDAFFSNIEVQNPGILFEYQKEAFFLLMDKFLRDGTILFVDPAMAYRVGGSPISPEMGGLKDYWLTINDSAAQWKASPEEIVAFWRQNWPVDAKSERDDEMAEYFREMPGIIWRTEDGTLVAS